MFQNILYTNQFCIAVTMQKSTINHLIHHNALTCSRRKTEVRKPDLNQKLVRKYWKKIQLKNMPALQFIHTNTKALLWAAGQHSPSR